MKTETVSQAPAASSTETDGCRLQLGPVTPMAAATPSPRWWTHVPKTFWAGTNLFVRLGYRSKLLDRLLAKTVLFTADRLVTLSMINFARWSVIDRVPTSAPEPVRHLRCPYILFETNFNGDAAGYFEAFAYVTRFGTRVIWYGCHGVPDMAKVGPFVDYTVKAQELIPYAYCAYPGATSKMIRSALELQWELNRFRQWVQDEDPDADEFTRGYQELLTRVQTLRDPRPDRRLSSRERRTQPNRSTCTLSVLAELQPEALGQLDGVFEQLQALPEDVPPPFPNGTHFARFARFDRLLPPHEGDPVDHTPYLLFSAWFDRRPQETGSKSDRQPIERYLGEFHNALTVAGLVGPLWTCCRDFDDDSEQATFVRYMLERKVDFSTRFAAYDGITVQQVTQALEDASRFKRFMIDTRGLKPGPLRDRVEEALSR